jgi:hypothetical protein
VVLAITEFVYGIKAVTLPFIVGPKLLGDNASKLPQGMLYKRTRVAGIHPFRGGRVVSTMVLCKVRRSDYARQLLKFVESVATTIPFGAEVGTYTRYAGSLLDGIDAMFGVGETEPLAGIRQEFDHDLGNPIRPSYFALIDGAEDKYPVDRLWVRDGGLLIGETVDSLQPLRDTNYVLFSIRGAETLTDVDTLPLQTSVVSAIELAASPDEADWKRAKAELVVLLQQLLTSPDLTRIQALQYHQNIVEQALEARRRASSVGTLSANVELESQSDLRKAAALLDLP